MKRSITLLLFLFPFIINAQRNWLKAESSDCIWQMVGSAGFSPGMAQDLQLAISQIGEPFVSFQDVWFSEKAFVMKFDGTNWVNIGEEGVSKGRADFPSFVFSPTGEPCVAYKDYTNSYKATVLKFDGTNWISIGDPGFSPGEIYSMSLAFSPSGEPYVAFAGDYYERKAVVMKFNGINWELVGLSGFSEARADLLSLAISPAGQPFVAFQDWAHSKKATVMKFNGTTWDSVGVHGLSKDVVYEFSFAFSPNGELYIAYQDWGNLGWATVKKFDVSKWVTVGEEGFSKGRSFGTSLAFNSSGEPCVAFSDADYESPYKATVMKYTGGEWLTIGDRGFTPNDVGGISIAFCPNGRPYVAYRDHYFSKATVMKFDYPAGIIDLMESKLSLYPNPVSTTLTLDFNEHNKIIKFIEIKDITGVEMLSLQTKESKINLNLESYPPGVYLIKTEINDLNLYRKVCKK